MELRRKSQKLLLVKSQQIQMVVQGWDVNEKTMQRKCNKLSKHYDPSFRLEIQIKNMKIIKRLVKVLVGQCTLLKKSQQEDRYVSVLYSRRSTDLWWQEFRKSTFFFLKIKMWNSNPKWDNSFNIKTRSWVHLESQLVKYHNFSLKIIHQNFILGCN